MNLHAKRLQTNSGLHCLGGDKNSFATEKKKIDQKNLGFAAALIFVTLIFWREMQLSKKANSRKSFSS
jgi:hypothetical protein